MPKPGLINPNEIAVNAGQLPLLGLHTDDHLQERFDPSPIRSEGFSPLFMQKVRWRVSEAKLIFCLSHLILAIITVCSKVSCDRQSESK